MIIDAHQDMVCAATPVFLVDSTQDDPVAHQPARAGATPVTPCGDYVPTGLVVMALRNASGEVMVVMVSVPSPTP